jgi:hypothetical protein
LIIFIIITFFFSSSLEELEVGAFFLPFLFLSHAKAYGLEEDGDRTPISTRWRRPDSETMEA